MIALVLPFMRDVQGFRLLYDLEKQTIKPDIVYLVDNGNVFYPSDPIDLNIEVVRKEKNVGTNAAWNEMFTDRFKDYKYVGVIGDDYRLHPNNLLRMYEILESSPTINAITCNIKQGKYLPTGGWVERLEKCKGKGHMGFSLFDREVLQRLVRPIPKEFKIFFGDNWIGYYLGLGGEDFYVTKGNYITHYHWQELGVDLKYREVIEEERVHWKAHIRGEKTL